MLTKNTNVWAYISLPIALARLAFHTEEEKQACKFHMNQAIVVLLFSLLSAIPCVGWVWGIFMIVCWIMGLVGACQQTEKPVPLIGGIKVIK